MYVLDTNVVSELMRADPIASVVNWILQQDTHQLFTTSVSEAELRFGVEIKPPGRKKQELVVGINQWLSDGFRGRILPFDSKAAKHYAEIASQRRREGRPISRTDCQIAAVARSCNAALVTRNVKDFLDIDIEIVNP